jgi:hypothetical protein
VGFPRASTAPTCVAAQRPPRAVRTPQALSTAATPRRLATPLAWASRLTGAAPLCLGEVGAVAEPRARTFLGAKAARYAYA